MNTNTTETNGNGAAVNTANGEQKAPQIRILGQYVRDLSFENPNAPQSMAPPSDGNGPDVSINVDVKAREATNGMYECILNINASAKRDDTTLFIAELSYAGMFVLENVPAESAQAVMLVEAPRQLFPFARRIIADMTRDGGYPPLMLDPVDFAALFRHQMAQRQKTDSVADKEAPSVEA